MKRVQKLWEHPLYQEHFIKLQQSEEQRIFCNHTLAHFLDVARLTYIYSLESGAGLDKELIYAAALLHDIGRWQQISEGIPHDKAGAALAGQLLPDCGFTDIETSTIQNAILHHRTKNASSQNQAQADTQPAAFCSFGLQNQPEESMPRSLGLRNQSETLALYLRQADKRCRCCFSCSASDECNWSEEQKNHQIIL